MKSFHIRGILRIDGTLVNTQTINIFIKPITPASIRTSVNGLIYYYNQKKNISNL